MKQVNVEVGDLIAHKENDKEIFNRVVGIDTVTSVISLQETEGNLKTNIKLSMLASGIKDKNFAHYKREI